MKYLRIHNISIHMNFHQNQFINECVRKKKRERERDPHNLEGETSMDHPIGEGLS